MLTSGLVTFEQLQSPAFKRWHPTSLPERKIPHRKEWELATICEGFHERRCLHPKATGLGFGVGCERLPCIFAEFGCTIIASDGEPIKEWAETGQHCQGDLTKLECWNAISETNRKRVSYETIDMRQILESYYGRFDFVWSTSSLEHLGSLHAGEEFILDSLRCLVPGGLAIHTTELAVFPKEGRDNHITCIYSRARIEAFVAKLNTMGRHVSAVDWNMGTSPEDYYVDQVPFDGPAHLKINVDGHVITSLALIIQ